jgi:hypothetical protein
MTHEGQLLLNYLLRVGKVECTRQFFPEISADTQTKQMDIAVKHGIVRRDQEQSGLFQTYLFVNAEYVSVLKKVLPEILK